MERDGELKRLMGQRADLVQRNVGKLNTVEVKLRLACLDQEIKDRKSAQDTSLLARLRSAFGRLFASS